MRTNQGRTVRFNMVMTEDESEMLRALAADRGVTNSDVVRALLREAHKKLVKTAGK